MRAIDADYMKRQVDIHGTNKYGMLDENIRVFIDQQPTIEPEPHWIPVTERLPEHSGWYLVTQILTEDDDQLVCPKWYPTWSGWYENKQVIAWMPMPEPWKGESNDRT